MPRQTSHFLLRGGLDLVTSPLNVEPGRLWTGLNYESVEAGYRRLLGYERKDGRPSPSEAKYWMLAYDLSQGQDAADPGDTLTGGTSGATAIVLAVTEDDYVIGELDERTFADGEALNVGGTPAGTADGTPRLLGAGEVGLDLDYRDKAATHRRNRIERVPGGGSVRGVWFYRGTLYAVRDVAGDSPSAAKMFKATENGWSEVALGVALGFDQGGEEPEVGDRISVAGGAEGTLAGYVVSSGAWSSDDAEGTLYLEVESGAFANNNTLRRGAAGSEADFATADGAAVATTLPAGGRYEFVNHNFKGQASSEEMFGVNGVGKAFSYNGIALIPISTGHSDDKPTHIAVHRNHLLLGYPGGSLIVSATGEPLSYVAGDGAAEIACGQNIYGLVGGVGVGNTLIVGSDHIQALYGQDKENFELADHSQEQTGGVEWTVQAVGGPLYMDNRGVRSVTTTQAYGNFVIGTMTADVQPWLNRQREERNVPISSMRVRSSDQYRVFFESGLGLIVYLGRGRPELSLMDYGVAVRCSVSAEDDDRIERVYFGSDDGWVYEAERGRSFDGEPIAAYARLPLNHVGMPARKKKFFAADLHIDLESRISMGIAAIFDDGSGPDQLQSDQNLFGGGGLWNEAAWDEFYLDSPLNGYGSFDLMGFGRNVSILLISTTAIEAPHILNGISLHWAPRRLER